VIAAFVLGLGDTNESAPNVNWNYDLEESNNTNGTLTITHANGETIDNSTIDFQGPTNGGSGFPDSYTAGDSAVINLASGASAGDEINIVFLSEDGGSSNIIGTFTLPPDFDNS
jgi:hypothetical protein